MKICVTMAYMILFPRCNAIHHKDTYTHIIIIQWNQYQVIAGRRNALSILVCVCINVMHFHNTEG